jgi:two-component system response regulator AtoC
MLQQMQRMVRPPAEAPRVVHGMVTVAPEMDVFFERLRRAARTHATVLVRGESGTGKELVAQALHRQSPRAQMPFRAINCATLDRELLTSELFGHVRGSFTGAIRDRTGLLQLASGGTLFLDEVAEMPLDVQARLLRVIQEKRFTPLGGSETLTADVRIVSATHRALRREVEQRRFREDLMYRLRVVVLYLPRLAERTGDIEALTWHFVREFNAQGYRTVRGITREALDRMLSYPWPGNVRELRNNLESGHLCLPWHGARLPDRAASCTEVLDGRGLDARGRGVSADAPGHRLYRVPRRRGRGPTVLGGRHGDGRSGRSRRLPWHRRCSGAGHGRGRPRPRDGHQRPRQLPVSRPFTVVLELDGASRAMATRARAGARVAHGAMCETSPDGVRFYTLCLRTPSSAVWLGAGTKSASRMGGGSNAADGMAGLYVRGARLPSL